MKLLVILGILQLARSAVTEDPVKTAAVTREKMSKGPPRRLKETVTVVVSLGWDVRLVCPVTGEPQPIVEWSKDGEVVDYTWTRINTNKNYLKLRAAQPGDTGVWNCRGVQCKEKSTTMQPMVVGKLSKRKESYPKCTRSTLSRQCVKSKDTFGK